MNLPEIKQYRFDVSGGTTENLVPRELIPASDERNAKIVVPRHAPFFIESVNVYRAGHTIPLNLGEHYDFVSIDHELSEYCGNRVSWVIRKLKDDLPDLEITYQTLGTVPVLTETTKYWYEAAALDQRPVWFDQLLNKPRHFIPMLHGHDLAKGFFNFSRIIEIYEKRYETMFSEDAMIPYRDWFVGQLNNLKTYVEPYRLLLERYTDNHIDNKDDPHGTRSKDIPGLDNLDSVKTADRQQILDGLSPKHRVVSGQAKERMQAEGPRKVDHLPNIFLGENKQVTGTVVGEDLPVPVTEISVGIKDILMSVYVDRTGVGRGEQMFLGKDGYQVSRIVNPNPISAHRNPEKNIWYNTHRSPGYDILIAGGNADARIGYRKSDKRWLLIMDRPQITDHDQQPTHTVTISGDMSDVLNNFREYRLVHTESAVHLVRTVDHRLKPTVIWKTIKYDKVAGTATAVTEYTFKYNTINDNTAYNERGRVVMFHRGFNAGKYSNGDLVFSDPVDLISEDNQVLLLPTVFKGKLYVEFLLPETFSYKGEQRRYVHSHMAEMNMNHSTKVVTLTWTDTRARPYIVTERLFSDNPEANNYFEQVAVPFPFELTSRSASLVSMSQEGYFGFGFKECGCAEMFNIRLTPGAYTLNEKGRLWHLADTGEFNVTRIGGSSPIVYDRLDAGHIIPMNPYMGVWAESNERHRYGLVKGIHSENGMGFFYKNLYGGVNDLTVAGVKVKTSLPLDNIDYVHDLPSYGWIGTCLDVSERESEFVWSVGGSDAPTSHIPNQVGFGGGNYKVINYVEATDAFLTSMGVNLSGHWTMVLGARYGLPDLIYNTYPEGGQVKTKVLIFRLNANSLTRIDGLHNGTPVSRLSAGDKATVLHQRTLTHTTPAYIKRTKVNKPEPTLNTNVINVLVGDSGRTTIMVCPNNRFGNDSHHTTYPVTLVINQSDSSVVVFDEERFDGCIGLSPDFGWVKTTFAEQTKFGGMINAGVQLNTGYQIRPSYIPAASGPVGMFNVIPENVHQLYFPVPMVALRGDTLDRSEMLVYNTKQLINGASAVYDIYLVQGPNGLYLEADNAKQLDDGYSIEVTQAGVKLI